MVEKNTDVIKLLKTARGQIDGVLKMIEDGKYCIDVSTQVMAARAVLGRANRQIIHAHMLSCVYDAFESGDESQKHQKIDEIVEVFDKLMK